MKREILSACLVLLCSASALANGLPNGVTELSGTSPALPNTDLQAMKKIFKKAKILAIGESAHGSAGYLEMQHRLIKDLVENYGYRKLMMELVSDDRQLNQYVSTCQGNIINILYHNGWYDDASQRAALYQWLCQYNQAHPNDKVTVHSVDPQKPWQDAATLRAYLHSISTTVEDEFSPVLEANCFGAADADQLEWAFSPATSAYFTTGTLPEPQHQACLAGIQSLRTRMNQKKIQWVLAEGLYDFLNAEDALRSLEAWQIKSYYLFSDPAQAFAVREAQFGPAVHWRWRGTSLFPKKAILVAHNLHIAKKELQATGAGDPWEGLITVGTYLRGEMGKNYQAIAQSGYQVSAMFSGNYPLPVASTSIDVTFHALAKPWLFLRTNASWVRNQGTWYVQEEGVVNGRPYDLHQSFDGLVFHDVSPAAVFAGNGGLPVMSARSTVNAEKAMLFP